MNSPCVSRPLFTLPKSLAGVDVLCYLFPHSPWHARSRSCLETPLGCAPRCLHVAKNLPCLPPSPNHLPTRPLRFRSCADGSVADIASSRVQHKFPRAPPNEFHSVPRDGSIDCSVRGLGEALIYSIIYPTQIFLWDHEANE